MNNAEDERLRDEGARVRVRTRVVRRDNPLPRTTDSLRSDLCEAERRFLSRQGSALVIPSPSALTEYLNILAGLKVIYGRLQEMSGRRDISYLADRRLTFLNNHCLWLTRRVSAEYLLILQIHLEREFRNVIGPDSYKMFLQLEDVADAAREVEMLSDHDMMARLREGMLFSEILERVPVAEAANRAQPTGVMLEPAE